MKRPFLSILKILFIFIFILYYLYFLIDLFIFQNNLEIPSVLLIGYTMILIAVFYFFMKIFYKNESNKTIIKFKSLNENLIKFILLFLLIITQFISSIKFTDSIIDWNQIGFLNYFRSIISLIGCLFLPGACIFNILLPNNTIHEKIGVESFLLKITVYPILSLTFLGILTFILDSVGLERDMFSYLLIASFVTLVILDFLIQKQKKILDFKNREINVSKFTLLILFVSLSIIIIGLGIHLKSQYLIPGDRWRGTSKAILVGLPDINPSDDTALYTLNWSYISFALSKICGIPYININAMLFPFLYLFITSIYMLIKAILRKYEEIYALLSTILFLLFAGLFYIDNEYLIYYPFTIFGILQFSFHTYALVSLFISLTFYIALVNGFKKPKLEKKDYKVIFLSALFILQSYFTYFLPIIPGISLMLIYILFSKEKKRAFKIFISFWLFLITLFIPLDALSFFFFSWIPITLLSNFLGFPVYIQAELFSTRRFLTSLMVDSFLIAILFFIVITYKIYKKYFFERFKKYYEFKVTPVFIIILLFFALLFILNIFLNIIFKIEQNFFLFYFDLIFTNIGLIGIIGFFSFYSAYKKDSKLFFILISWIIFSIGLASSFIYKNFISYPLESPLNFPEESYYYMIYWFDRIWFYSIVPLSIMASIGLLSFRRKVKKIKIRSLKNWDFILRIPFISLLIFYSFSNTIITGMYWGSIENYYVINEEAQMIGWIEANIPRNSNILIDRFRLKSRIDDITYSNTYWIWEEKIKAFENFSGFKTSYHYDENCLIEPIENLDGRVNITKFDDQNSKGNCYLNIEFDSEQKNATIQFYIKTSNNTKSFYTYLIDPSYNIATIISISEEAVNFYDGIKYNNITKIESNLWYDFKIDFECTDGNYSGLEKFNCRIHINGTKFPSYSFWNNASSIQFISYFTKYSDFGWSIYLDDINFSWVSTYMIENYIFNPVFFIDYLKSLNIQYFIISKDSYDFCCNKDLLAHYQKKLYEYSNLMIYAEQ